MSGENDEHGVTNESASDTRISEMVNDPATYFTKSRLEAKREARRYIAKRLRAAKTA